MRTKKLDPFVKKPINKANANVESMEDEASRLLEGGKLRRAERILERMLANDPNCLPAHFQLARVYYRTEEYERALLHGHRTLRLNPKETNACLNLGLIYEFMDRAQLASRYYKKELFLNPDSGETLFNIGLFYFRRHRWLNASKYLRRCFDIGYSFRVDDTVYNLGECYCELRDLRSFIDVYRRYLAMVPNAEWAAANLGGALLRTHDYKHAILWLTRARQLGNRTKTVAVDLVRAKKLLMNKRAKL